MEDHLHIQNMHAVEQPTLVPTTDKTVCQNPRSEVNCFLYQDKE